MLKRNEINFFGNWYSTIDVRIMYLSFFLIVIGNLFVFLVSPIIAARMDLDYNFFIIKHSVFSVIAMFLIVFLSLFSEEKIKKIAFIVFPILLMLLVLVLVIGARNKGAKRWLYLAGISIQPSEIIRPFFVVITSFLLTKIKKRWSVLFAVFIYMIVAVLLILEPDLGMFFLITMIFTIELFLTDIDLRYIFILGMITIILSFLLYFIYPHFTYRVDTFINTLFFEKEKTYQVEKSLEAFANGGLMGKGIFEGTIKNYIPDSHTDFIFSVIGEEFGALICVLIVSLYFYIVIRLVVEANNIKDNFKYISVISMSIMLLFQTFINIGVTLNILPTKGMTLPLISYGGSSMFGTAIMFGFLLVFTRKVYGKNENEIIINNCSV